MTHAEASAVDSDRAHREAAAAASQARVAVRDVHDLDDLRAVVALFDRLWDSAGQSIIGAEHLRALTHSGNYAAGAFDLETGAMLAASIGFFGAPPWKTMHSDVTGVDPAARDRGLGLALKLHQRAWAIDLGLDQITWTFDPLVSRNAYFNLSKLGARVAEYSVDFYGEMSDGVNAGQGSDRLHTRWDILEDAPRRSAGEQTPALLVDAGGEPKLATPAHAAPEVTVAIPRDIGSVRADDPGLARSWRLAVRETLGSEMAAGGSVVGFSAPAGYVVARPVEDAAGIRAS
jgi:predicted GNAT superfamily acetyltransferase